MREQSLHVDLPGSADEGVEGPQQEWLGGPGSSRDPLHVQNVGKIFDVQYPALEVPAYSLLDFNDKNFQRSYEDDKPA
jgi:hypothetical protein